ncbi:MAG: hypothetical protein K1X94_03920 [Sandaracinaceae bacterium]|nr:hypothetical protein [Sandaracinaceae bacterium]
MLLDPTSPRRRAALRGLAILATSLVAGGVMWAPAFYESDHSGWGDWQQMHHWAEVGVVSMLRWGEFPFWNPHHCGGVPHWGQPQAQNFSPIWMLLHLPFGTHLGHKLWILFHHVIGFAGLYLVGRKLEKLSRAGAFLAATIWTASGFSAWHYAGGHATFLAFEWYPFLLLAWRRADDDVRYTVAVAAIMTEMLLEGAHYAFPYAAVFLGFDSVARILRGKKVEILHLLRTGVISALLTLLLGAVRWVPIMLAMSRYPRPIEDTDTLTFDEIVLMWTAREHDWLWRPHPWVWAEYGTYVGWGVLALVALGIALALRERRFLPVAGALFFLAFTMGYHGPLWPSSILHSLPFFSNLHLPSRWQVLCTLYMSLLAGVALSRFEVGLTTKRFHRDGEWARALLPWLVALGLTADVYVSALMITNRWDGPLVGFSAPETPHITASRNYFEEYANYPSRNVSTLECYDAVPWPRGTHLWTGQVPQVRFAAEDGTTPRTGDTLHAYDRTNHTVTIDVELAAPGVAIVNQNFEPQWHASAGELAPSEGRLAVRLPAGRHRVVFRFEPDDLPYSALTSLAGVIAGILILVLARPKASRAAPTATRATS